MKDEPIEDWPKLRLVKIRAAFNIMCDNAKPIQYKGNQLLIRTKDFERLAMAIGQPRPPRKSGGTRK